jgi:3'(2'), 5'-bisphosphate nucleotidase
MQREKPSHAPPMSPGSRLFDAVRIVEAAVSLARAVQDDVPARQGMDKTDRSPVTVADFAVQAYVVHALRARFGTEPLVGEESAEMLHGHQGAPPLRRVMTLLEPLWPEVTEAAVLEAVAAGQNEPGSSGYWTLDPVDGTKGFVEGGHYAVQLAYIEHGIPVLGVLACPRLRFMSLAPAEYDDVGSLYWAQRGSGAFGRPLDSPPEEAVRICADDGTRHDRLRLLESRDAGHSDRGRSGQVLRSLAGSSTPEFVRMHSGAKYAVLASGQGDLLFRLPRKKRYEEKIWDHAPGVVLVEEAGAVVSDVFGRPLDFSRGRTLAGNTGLVVASSRGLHQRALEALRENGVVACVE